MKKINNYLWGLLFWSLILYLIGFHVTRKCEVINNPVEYVSNGSKGQTHSSYMSVSDYENMIENFPKTTNQDNSIVVAAYILFTSTMKYEVFSDNLGDYDVHNALRYLAWFLLISAAPIYWTRVLAKKEE